MFLHTVDLGVSLHVLYGAVANHSEASPQRVKVAKAQVGG